MPKAPEGEINTHLRTSSPVLQSSAIQKFEALKAEFPPLKGKRVEWKKFRSDGWRNAYIQWESAKFYDQYQEFNQAALKRKNLVWLSAAISLYYPGKSHGLKRDIGFAEVSMPRGGWTLDRIEDEVRNFQFEHGNVNTSLLRKYGRNDLTVAIVRNYPGQWRALYEKLGVAAPQKESGYWTPERVEQQAREFFDNNGNLTGPALKKDDKGDLLYAISARYPGGMNGLKRKLGFEVKLVTREIRQTVLEVPRDKSGMIQWRVIKRDPARLKEVIETEMRAVMEQGVGISADVLRQLNKGYLVRAIMLHYPGGFPGLREAMGERVIKRIGGYWTTEEGINDLVEQCKEVIGKHKKLSFSTLRNAGKAYLIDAIKTNYPGGILKLKAEFEVEEDAKPSGYWSVGQIEKEAGVVYQLAGDLSKSIAEKFGEVGLAGAVTRNYPGGYKALKRKLGIQDTIKYTGYWTEEKIIEEARAFYEEHGVLTSKAMQQQRRNDLVYAIGTKYEGGFIQLRVFLGIENDKSNVSDKANADLEKLLEGGI